jgi:hypothetical protein
LGSAWEHLTNATKGAITMTARKETTVKEADAKAEKEQGKGDLEKLILQEAIDLESGKQHSIQQMLAYVRQINKIEARKKK